MKKYAILLSTLIWYQIGMTQAEKSVSEIGDNLDLYAVLDAFKDAESIEAFEETINNPKNKINNIDLDEDGEVDYVEVHDEGEGDAHALILRVSTGENEAQDLAAIELEKMKEGEAYIQIVGDEEIYGAEYIIEPKDGDAVTERLAPNLVVVNVWGWRSVRFIFAPNYVRWHSPWGHKRYPNWWKPWKPYPWTAYTGFHKHHHNHFHQVKVRRCPKAHGFYMNHHKAAKNIHQHSNHHNHNHNKGHNNHPGHNGPHKNPNGQRNNKVNNGGAQKNHKGKK